MSMSYRFGLLLLIVLLGCQQSQIINPAPKETDGQPVATSLSGAPLYPFLDSDDSKHTKDSLLQIAKVNYQKDSTNLDNIIWYGRRVAYLYDYEKAIDIFTIGMDTHPDAPELYRHRGHRYITTRKFTEAIADFQRASQLVQGRAIEIEPDGIPNKLNIPLSNLQFNIYYHWGLVHFLKGEYGVAANLFRVCLKYSDNPDLHVATSDWFYMSLMKSGKTDAAREIIADISPNLEIIENDSYYKRLLFYKGLLPIDSVIQFDNKNLDNVQIVTQGYGIANWYEFQGDHKKADQLKRKILDTGTWNAFAYIAAEADFHRSELEK